jgi:hypothetical protein
LNAAIEGSLVLGQLLTDPKLGKDVSFDSIVDDEFGDLICSSQVSIKFTLAGAVGGGPAAGMLYTRNSAI